MINEWLDIVEKLTTEEKEEIYNVYDHYVSDKKIAADIAEYFEYFIGSQNMNSFGEEVPDEGYTKDNLLWALGLY